MTNQDVINFLNQVRKMLLDDRSWLESTIQPINEAFDMAISALKKQTLPSAQLEPQWIPVSEKLPEHPENNDYYLVTIQCEHYDGWDDYVTGFAEWTKHGWDEISCYIGQIKVVAWMPLPEPYQAESEDTE